MELEERVKALEYEVKILKNQIQGTLLDIKEQILIHYYPSLRAEESSPSEGVLRSFEAILSEKGKEGLEVFIDTSESASTMEPNSTDSEPLAHPFMEEIEDALKGVPTSPEEQPPPRPDKEVDWVTFTALVGWASESIERIGRERTRKVIEICTKGGYLDTKVKDVLLQLVSLSNEETPPEKVDMKEVTDALLELRKVLEHRTDVE